MRGQGSGKGATPCPRSLPLPLWCASRSCAQRVGRAQPAGEVHGPWGARLLSSTRWHPRITGRRPPPYLIGWGRSDWWTIWLEFRFGVRCRAGLQVAGLVEMAGSFRGKRSSSRGEIPSGTCKQDSARTLVRAHRRGVELTGRAERRAGGLTTRTIPQLVDAWCVPLLLEETRGADRERVTSAGRKAYHH